MEAAVDRRARSEERPLRRIFLVWLAVSVLLFVGAGQSILVGRFPDPDDVMRLVQVRDLLAGQAWFDVTQYRLTPANPLPMHWSRIVDVPLAIIIGGLTPLLGQPLAEQVGSIIVPLLTMLVAMIFIGRMAWRLFDIETATFACLAMGFLPLLVFQFQPLRIDHHGWQICTVIAAMWAINGRLASKGGVIAGVAMAIGVAISLELLPIAALFGGVLALRWLRDPAQRWWLTSYLQALALALAILFAATKGFGDLTPYCDALTLPHIGFFASVAVAATALAFVPNASKFIIVSGLAVAGIAGVGVFAFASPECLRTPFGALDPLVETYWYDNVLEGKPIWDQPGLTYPIVLQVLLGLAATVYLWRKAEAWKRAWWQDYLLVFVGTVILGLLVWRSMAFASILAALPLGWLLQRGIHALRTLDRPIQRIGILLAALPVLMPSSPALAAYFLFGSNDQETKGPLALSSCDLDESATQLSSLPNDIIFAPLDIGPALLQRSPHAVVATGHHRAEKAMRDVIVAFTSTPEMARPIIEKHDGRYIVLCADLLEPAVYTANGDDNNLASLLRDGEAPEWLEAVDLDTPETFKVWRVVD